MWGERGLISHKFEGTGEGGAGVCTEGWPRSCARVHGAAECEPGVQLAVARWARLAAGRVHNECGLGMYLAVARWARLAAGRVHNGRAAGGYPMGQAGSRAGAQWACSWRLPDGPDWQLGGCTMGVQLAVARWARLAAGQVHNERAAGGCPMGQAVSWACYGYPGVLPRMPDTHDMQARFISHTKLWWWQVILLKSYIFRYHNKHSVIYAHIHGIICHMIYSYTTMAVERGAYEHNKIQKGLLWYMWMSMTRGCRSTFWLPCNQQQNFHTSSVYTD